MSPTKTSDTPIASTKLGDLKGRYRKGVSLFCGIPYAEAPVGKKRFAPPSPPNSWDGIRDASYFSPAAPQLPGDGITNRLPVRWDEDCLYLNIVTPACDDLKRPVYLWIHGGGYQHGQGAVPWYDGTSFATQGDIVVVTINYRLGAFGFCNLEPHFGKEFASSGLNGMLDQIEALHWIRDHIACFGGNPDQVTIGGESAGAFSVSNLLASPMTDGLFHKAIAQSGAAHHVHDPEMGEQISAEFLSELGNPGVEEIKELPPLSILEAQETVIQNHGYTKRGIDPFYPTWGHEALTNDPLDLISQGAGASIPLLTGTNEDEMALWGLTGLDESGLKRYANRVTSNPETFIRTYENRLGKNPGWIACALGSDWVFRIPAIRHAEARSRNSATTWMYQFSWDSRAFGGRFGSAHALEIPFTFNTLDRAGVEVFIGEGDIPNELAETIHDAWIAFIKNGDPSTPILGFWPPYSTDERAVMNFDTECNLRNDPEADERILWDEIR